MEMENGKGKEKEKEKEKKKKKEERKKRSNSPTTMRLRGTPLCAFLCFIFEAISSVTQGTGRVFL